MKTAQHTQTSLRPALYGGIAASIGVIVGSLGTWISVLMFSVNGLALQGWGRATLVLGIAAAVLLLALVLWDRPARDPVLTAALAWAVVVAGVCCLTVALIVMIRVLNIPEESLFGVSFRIGWGLLLVAFASFVLTILAAASAALGPAGRARWTAILISAIVLVTGILYAYAVPFSGSDIAEDLITEISGS